MWQSQLNAARAGLRVDHPDGRPVRASGLWSPDGESLMPARWASIPASPPAEPEPPKPAEPPRIPPSPPDKERPEIDDPPPDVVPVPVREPPAAPPQIALRLTAGELKYLTRLGEAK